MYVPRPFAVDSADAQELLQQVRVAHLVTATDDGPLATLLPWVADLDEGMLIGHMARPNPQWRTPWHGPALVVAEGPNGYVSPSWYASKTEHGRVVPTWDYVVLQVYGELVVHDDETWVGTAVRRLTERHERSRTQPWSVDDAPVDYVQGQLRGVVGLAVRIERIEASMKLSQNKSEADAAGVVAGFAADGDHAMADWVRRATS